jgi:ArsR family transcriptional regulator
MALRMVASRGRTSLQRAAVRLTPCDQAVNFSRAARAPDADMRPRAQPSPSNEKGPLDLLWSAQSGHIGVDDIDPVRCFRYRKYTMKPRAAEAELCCPPEKQKADSRPIEGDEADEELSTLAKALGHPARVKILRILVRRDACICGDIVDELPLAQSTVSQHLKVLKDAGLIRGDVDGPRVCYCIEQRALRRLKALIGGL